MCPLTKSEASDARNTAGPIRSSGVPQRAGGLGHDERIERVARSVGLTLAQRCGLGRRDVTRADAVALDVVFAVLRSDVAGQHLQSAFGCGVGRDGLAAQLRHHRADVDDLALALLDHRGDDGLRDDERAVEVDVDHLAELRGGHLDHRDALDDAGVVDEDVHDADLFFDLRHHGVHLLLAGHVADVAFGLDALGLVGGQAFVHQLLFDVVEDDFCALTCESRCQCESDAVRGARHERDLTFQ